MESYFYVLLILDSLFYKWNRNHFCPNYYDYTFTWVFFRHIEVLFPHSLYYTQSNPILSNHILSNPILSNPIQPYPIQSYPTLSNPINTSHSYFILSYILFRTTIFITSYFYSRSPLYKQLLEHKDHR